MDNNCVIKKGVLTVDINEQLDEAYINGYTDAESKFRELIGAEPGWIPVTKALPEREELVLATCWDGDELFVDTCTWFGETLGFRAYGYWVVAWRPLPEPYNGVRKKRKEVEDE